MADETTDAAADQPQQEKPKKGGSMKLIIIIAVAVAVLGAGGFVGYKMFLGGKVKTEGGEHGGEKKKEEKNVLIALDPFVLNLSEQGRFLKVTMQFELISETDQPMVAGKTPQLRDAIITLLSSKSAESVSTPEGKFQLKDEVLLRANQAMGKNVFKNLYFTEFVMQ